MTSIGWLHISDLHWTYRRPGWTERAVIQQVFDDLAELHHRAGPWDLVIIAGDLSLRGAPDDFEQADVTLDMLTASLRALGSRPVLLAVPGNHDVARPHGPSTSALRALDRWHDDPAARDAFWNDLDSPGRRLVDRALEPFGTWWKKHSPEGLRHGLLPGDFTFTLEKDGVRLGVAGLCTSFLQVTGDDYEGRLAVAPHQLAVAAGGDVPTWIARHDAALLVTHHPPRWLAPDARARFEAEIHPAGRFAAHLCAHLHDAAPLVETGTRTRIHSPSFFGLEAFEDRRGKPHERRLGYVASRLVLDDGEARLEVFPRIWNDDRMRLEPATLLEAPLPAPDRHKVEVAVGSTGGRRKSGKPLARSTTTEARRRGGNEAVAIPIPRVRRSAGEPSGPLLERAMVRDALAAIYPSPADARRLLREAGLSADHLPPDGASVDVWQEAVSEAARQELLGDLVKIARVEYPNDARLAEASRAYEKAAKGARGTGSRSGADDRDRADAYVEKLASLPAPAFEAALSLVDLDAHVPGPEAPLRSRAMAAVLAAEQSGESGLTRLGIAIGTTGANVANEAAGLDRGPARAPTKPSLTQLLTAMFPDDRDFDGFVRSHFPDAYFRFARSTTRARRTSALLDEVAPADVVAVLRRFYPSAFAEHQRVLDYEDPDDDAAASWRGSGRRR